MVCSLCIAKAYISVVTSNILGAALFGVTMSLLEDWAQKGGENIVIMFA